MRTFKRVAAGLAEGFLTARYHEALRQMNDHQLADLGLTREGIPQRARELARMR